MSFREGSHMRTPARYALSLGAAAALLAGCGGSQLPFGVPGATPQQRAVTAHADRIGSWMLPEAKGEDLLYAGNDVSGVKVFSYPAGKLVGTIEGAYGLCSDRNGNIFAVASGGTESTIREYAHGGTKPIRTLNNGNAEPFACSVDPTTGNLAVINFATDDLQKPGDVAIYKAARGKPNIYSDPDIPYFWSGSYDNEGNLLVDTEGCCVQFAELSKGGTALTNVTLSGGFVEDAATVQWDGKDFAVGAYTPKGKPKWSKLSIISLTGSSGTLLKKVVLRGLKVNFACLQGKVAIAIFGARFQQIGFWHYPESGKPFQTIDGYGTYFTGATVSLARR
jgi:hypothetical protein